MLVNVFEGESVRRGDTLLQLALASTSPTNHQIVSGLNISKCSYCSTSLLMISPTDVRTCLPIRYIAAYQVAEKGHFWLVLQSQRVTRLLQLSVQKAPSYA